MILKSLRFLQIFSPSIGAPVALASWHTTIIVGKESLKVKLPKWVCSVLLKSICGGGGGALTIIAVSGDVFNNL